ncbi:MAG: cell surface protein SprA [Chitinophagaceae bacterium]
MQKVTKYIFQFVVLFSATFLALLISQARNTSWEWMDVPSVDSPETKKDTLPYPIQDRYGDKFNNELPTQFDLNDPRNVKTTIEYNPDSSTYEITEKVGNQDYRPSTYMSFEEFMKYQSGKDEQAYFMKRKNTMTQLSKKGGAIPKINLGNVFMDQIFGGSNIEVKPQGNVDLTFGGNWQNVQNPTLVQSAQKYGIFDFNMNMNINLLAKVGEKMKMNFNFNDKATFDFENQLKLEYNGKEDNIIRKIEAGYIGFPLKTQLIQGVQSLFGLKTQLQFGRLMVNAVASQQKSKRESFTIKGGAQTSNFSVSCDNYDDFRHFLLAHTFRKNFNTALKNFPIIQSLNNINRIEVWVTNRTGTVENARDIVAFQDLGEPEPYRTTFMKANNGQADNSANTLYSQVIQTPGARDLGSVVTTMQSIGLKGRIDFEKTFARKLNTSEYTFNPQLGTISINAQLQPDDVVGVAYEYTNNGKVYQLGEFSQSLPPDSTNPKILFLKMLKSTSPDPTVPLWDLMMKNVYSLGASQISNEDFNLNVFYLDPGGGEKRYLPEGPQAGVPLIKLLNLDRLNNQNDPQPDGRFDYIDGVTIFAQQGRIMFPVLEPFGEDMRAVFGGSVPLEKKYLYNILYDSTKNIAIQFPQYNRFLIKGTYQSSNSSEIYLGGFNIPQGSVNVSAGGQKLTENVDYSIDYGIGKLRILNSGILSSGIPISVSYENNATFGFQQQNFVGTRLDYFVSENINIGGTALRLSERPYFNKVNFGDDPIKNTQLGLDFNFQKDQPRLTRFIDKLPIVSTTAPSMVVANGEIATLKPGHSKLINVNGESNVYIDDFEGTRSGYDLKFPVTSWSLASTPNDAVDKTGQILFPEASLVNNWNYGKNRAKLAWYNIDPCLVDVRQTNCMPSHLKNDTAQLSNHYLRLVQQQDVFPLRSYTSLQGNLTTLDLGFYPKERGPYNFDSKDITNDGKLLFPTKRWGGIMRPIDYSDFETANVEFIEFWMMDPFINRPTDPGGSFYINLGNVSEDILKDSRKFYENGLPYPDDPKKTDQTAWSKIPRFQQQLTPAFDNDANARAAQDLGLDGLSNADEVVQFKQYLDELLANFGATSPVYLSAVNDPSNDDFHHFRGSDFDNNNTSVFERYRKYNNPQGNSPVNNNSQFSNAFTNVPENEDINRDNTLNENEQYFQYRIDIKPNMVVGENYIVNKQVTNVKFPNNTTSPEVWYQFKVPIREFSDRVGGISDFKSIRFIRMFLTGFQDSIIMRLSRLELGRNQWRKYNFSLRHPGEMVPDNDNNSTLFNLLSVSLEENSGRSPIPYVMPPGIIRQQQQVSNGQNIQNNEQSLSMQVCNLEDGNAKGAFKNLGMDMRQFERIRMFIHAEGIESKLKDGDLRAFIRVGSDFVSNYYEYQIPLTFTSAGTKDPQLIWPEKNELDLYFADLVGAKLERNKSGASYLVPYIKKDAKGNYIKIVGNPNIGDVKMCMLGILNPQKTPNDPNDDGDKKCAEVWFNELRLSGMNEEGGYAAIGNVDVQLADVGVLKLSGNMHTAGYGNIDQKVNQRYRDNFSQFDASANINGGKFLPKSWGVQLPIFAGYTQSVSNPVYDPYDLDIKYKDKIEGLSQQEKDSIKRRAQDFNSVKSINFQNVRIAPANNKRKEIWDLQNFDLSYSYTQTNKRNPLIEKDQLDEHQASIGYTFAPKSRSIKPFNKVIPQKWKYLKLLKDFNFNLIPSNFTFRNSLSRTLGETIIRNIDEGSYPLEPLYYKFFTWNRVYSLRWALTESLSFDYSANNNSRIDEPYGRIDTKAKKDTFWNNVGSFGRNTLYTHNLNANYNVPLSKFPLLDWTSLRASYTAGYNWTASSLLAKSLGNTLGNTQNKQINGELNFSSLYNKVKFLRKITSPIPNRPGNNPSNRTKTPTLDGRSPNQSKNERDTRGNEQDQRISKNTKNDRTNLLGQNTGTNSDNTQTQDTPTTSDTKDRKETKDTKDTKATDIIETDQVPTNSTQQQDTERASTTAKSNTKSQTTKKNVSDSLSKKQVRALAKQKRKEEKKKKDWQPSKMVRGVGNVLLMVKRASFSYNENQGTILPGYMDSTQYLGMNFSNQLNPGLPFAFGVQPDRLWLEQKGKDNVLTRDSLFNAQFSQQFSQALNITANLEPVKDFKIDFTLTKSFNKAHSELYKDTIGGGSDYVSLNPYETGGFSISYIAINTLFQKTQKGELSSAFYAFENNRKIISNRLGIINPYTAGTGAPEDEGYAKGYTRYAQEVLIPAFLSAYQGKDARTYPLVDSKNESTRSNPFKNILPLPNWRVNYGGLARTKMFKNIFQSFTLNHAYNGTLSINSFNSSLMYRDVFALGFPSFIDSITGNYVPYFVVPNMTITENFGPLLGIDATLQNSMNIHIEYKKARTLSMSLIDFQLSETKSKEIAFGGGIRLKKVKVPIKYFGIDRLRSDVNIKADFALRDDRTSINRLDQHETRDTRGQKVITISPSIDYILNQNVTIRFFYDRRQSIPYVSNAYPITTTRGGVMIRFMLGQ